MDSEPRPEEMQERRDLERVHTLCRHVGVGEYPEQKVLRTWPLISPRVHTKYCVRVVAGNC